ncbi:hypothetical protein D3C73_1517330 [compost metagenome]
MIQVGHLGDAEFSRSRDQAVGDLRVILADGNVQGAADAAPVALAELMIFDSPESALHGPAAPALGSKGFPLLVVLRVAAKVHHPVD